MPDAITVYFATNRMPITQGRSSAIIGFGADPGPIDGTAVRFGAATVAVTPTAAGGYDGKIIDGSLSVADEKLYGKTITHGSRTIFDQLRQSMIAGGAPTLVFVHGFSNSFTDAVERAATIAAFYDLPKANIFLFSWPSQSSLGAVPLPYVDYRHDRRTAAASGLAMARTLRILYRYIESLDSDQRCRQDLHLICHSMGNYALRHAVQALMQLPDGSSDPDQLLTGLPTGTPDPHRLRRTFNQIILAAADEDDDSFADPQELQYLPRLAQAVTVYHNRKDWVLSFLSRETKFNGPRLGVDGPDNMAAVSDKVTAIEVSDVLGSDDDLVQHQYYRQIPAVRDDIVAVLTGERPQAISNREATGPQRYRLLGRPAGRWSMIGQLDGPSTLPQPASLD